MKLLYKTKTRQATWLELFFDLVFVAVIGVVSHNLAPIQGGRVGIDQLLRFPLVFIPAWWVWATHTLYANRFDNDDRIHRFFALIIMGLMVFLSTYVNGSLGHRFIAFVMIYCVIRGLFAILYMRINSRRKRRVSFAKDMARAIFIGAIISLSSIFFSGIIQFALFYGGIAIDMLLQLSLRKKTSEIPVDRKHLVERIGLLTLIILGEAVIGMVGSLSKIEVWDAQTILAAFTGFVLIWAIWWIYFDSFGILERAKRITDGNTLIYSHLIFYMGLLVLARLIRSSIQQDLNQETFRLLAIAGMCGFYLGKQITYMRCFPPFRKRMVLNTLTCLAITVVSTYLPTIEYSMLGITVGMLLYVFVNFHWVIPMNASAYFDKEARH